MWDSESESMMERKTWIAAAMSSLCAWNGPAPVFGTRNYAWGITHFHHTGTGWIHRFYNYFLFTPYSEGAAITVRSRLDDEEAQPGRYAASLTDYGAAVELTVDRYAACHRYRFSKGCGRLRIDLRQGGLRREFVEGVCPGYRKELPSKCEVREDGAAAIIDLIRRCRFRNGPGGCPGNNDSGGTSSWYVWNCLGIYPLTGTPYYLLGTPSIDFAEVCFPHGKLRIAAERESPKSIYPAGYSFNRKKLHVPYLEVEKIEGGGELKFCLADKPSTGVSPVPDWL